MTGDGEEKNKQLQVSYRAKRGKGNGERGGENTSRRANTSMRRDREASISSPPLRYYGCTCVYPLPCLSLSVHYLLANFCFVVVSLGPAYVRERVVAMLNEVLSFKRWSGGGEGYEKLKAHIENAMTDLYIEQANTAFQQLWIGGGQIAATSPQLSEAFFMIQKQMQQHQQTIQLLHARARSQDEAVDKLRDENHRLSHSVLTIAKRVEQLEGENGFMTKPDVLLAVRSLPELESIPALREQQQLLHQRLQDATSEWREQLKLSQRQLHETITRVTGDDIRSIRSAVSRIEEERQISTQLISTNLAKLTHTVQEVQSQFSRDIKDIEALASRHAQTAVETSRMELEASMSQVIAHLKSQAQAVDALTQLGEKRSEELPTVEQLERVREEMRTTRSDMDRAQFRLHEAYSQMMSLTRNVVAAPHGRRADESSAPLSSYASAPEKDASTQRKSAPARDEYASFTGVSQSIVVSEAVDTAVEPIRRELSKLQAVTIPSLTSAVSIQRETLDSLVAAQQRAHSMMVGLLSCLGLQGRFDELLSSIEVMDAGRISLMFRKVFETVLPHLSVGQIERPNVPPRAATPDLSPIVPAPAVNSHNGSASGVHTPLHYSRRTAAVDRHNSEPFSLGVDVADVDVPGGGTASGGAVVMHVIEGSVAQSVGLRRGETVLTVNGEAVQSAAHFARLMRHFSERAKRSAVLGTASQPGVITLQVQSTRGAPWRTLDIPVL